MNDQHRPKQQEDCLTSASASAVNIEKDKAMAVFGAGDRSSASEGSPPSHFFSRSYNCIDNQLFLSHQQRNRFLGQASQAPALVAAAEAR
ncbi:hypothetical protein ACHAXM_009919, partial [Skeletonema potamos]